MGVEIRLRRALKSGSRTNERGLTGLALHHGKRVGHERVGRGVWIERHGRVHHHVALSRELLLLKGRDRSVHRLRVVVNQLLAGNVRSLRPASLARRELLLV